MKIGRSIRSLETEDWKLWNSALLRRSASSNSTTTCAGAYCASPGKNRASGLIEILCQFDRDLNGASLARMISSHSCSKLCCLALARAVNELSILCDPGGANYKTLRCRANVSEGVAGNQRQSIDRSVIENLNIFRMDDLGGLYPIFSH